MATYRGTRGQENAFRVDGQALKKTEGTVVGTTKPEVSMKEQISLDIKDEDEITDTEIQSEEASGQPPIITQLLDFNQNLQQQIDTLRLRLVFDAKNHEEDKTLAVKESNTKLRSKETEIDSLKTKLASKEVKLGQLANENAEKEKEIKDLQQNISDLKRDINIARSYAKDLEKELMTLQVENDKLDKGTAYNDKENHITDMKREIQGLMVNLATLEKELEKARGIISTQGSRIRLLENEKKNLHVKFKEDMARMSLSMRNEVERMREVMKSQWEEMRIMRQQNEGMCSDIKEIKELLLNSNLDTNRSKSPPTYGQIFKPTLPTLTKDTKRILTGKRK